MIDSKMNEHTNDKLSDLGTSAIELAGDGLRVFPLRPRTKDAQLISSWKNEATTDTATIAGWWSQWPEANIGIFCQPSGLVVIDVDGHEGEVAIERLEHDLGPLPATLEVTTGRGRHLYFRADVESDIVQRPLGTKLDVRWAGYVVAPPSIHPDGPTYNWSSNQAAAPLPDAWLCVMGQDSKSSPGHRGVGESRHVEGSTPYAQAALQGECEAVRFAPEGDRNNQLNISAMKLAQLESSGQLAPTWQEEIADAARAVGLDEREIWPTIESGREKGLTEPRTAPISSASQAMEWSGSESGEVRPGRTAKLGKASGRFDFNLRPLSNFHSKPTKWLDKPFIPEGHLVLIDGDTSAGKTLIVAHYLGCLTTGRPVPASGVTQRPLDALVFPEDEPGEFRALIDRAGGDVERIIISNDSFAQTEEGEEQPESFKLEHRLVELEQTIDREKFGLVVFDRLMDHAVKDITNYQSSTIFKELSGVAQRTGCTIIGIRHFTKDPQSALGAGHGGSGVGSAARVILNVMNDPDDPKQGPKTLNIVKTNRKSDNMDGLRFEVKQDATSGDETPWVVFLSERETRSPDELLAARRSSQTNADGRTRSAEVREVFISELMEAGLEGLRPDKLRSSSKSVLGYEVSDTMYRRVTSDKETFNSFPKKDGDGRILEWRVALTAAVLAQQPRTFLHPDAPFPGEGASGADSEGSSLEKSTLSPVDPSPDDPPHDPTGGGHLEKRPLWQRISALQTTMNGSTCEPPRASQRCWRGVSSHWRPRLSVPAAGRSGRRPRAAC